MNREAIHRLMDQRARLWDEMSGVIDTAHSEQREMTPEECQRYDALEADVDKLSEQIDRLERHEQRREQLETVQRDSRVLPGGDRAATTRTRVSATEEYRSAFWRMIRTGPSRMRPEEMDILERGFVMMDTEDRAQGADTDNVGGYTVPDLFFNRIVESMAAIGGVRQSRATIYTTASGADLLIPTDDDTAQEGEILAEGSAVTEQDVIFGQVTIPTYMYSSKLIRVSRQLLQDSAFDMEGHLAGKIARRLGKIQNKHYTTGTGVSQPKGVVTASSQGVQGAAGQTTSIIYDNLVDLEHSVDPDYRGAAEWMMNDSSLKVIRKLKDGNGLPIWQPSVQAGVPSLLSNYPYVINQAMASMAASAKSVLFGDFSQFMIREVQGIQVLRLNERYAEYLQVAFLGFQRAGGNLLDAGTDPLKHYANSAT